MPAHLPLAPARALLPLSCLILVLAVPTAGTPHFRAANVKRVTTTLSTETAALPIALRQEFGDSCRTDEDCDGSCVSPTVDLDPCPSSSENCICVPRGLSFCGGNDDCSQGTECFEADLGITVKLCLDPDLGEAFGLKSVCIDARALTHLSPSQLVFENNVLARVLCDENGSCATPGHMVSYRGTPMMMKKYCALTKCRKALRYVNSPRYRRAVRVQSKTDGLHYTAFAARYETQLEEIALTTAVRAGL